MRSLTLFTRDSPVIRHYRLWPVPDEEISLHEHARCSSEGLPFGPRHSDFLISIRGHKFVRRIDIPAFQEGLRGFTGNLKTHRAYFSTSNRRVGAFDLETEKLVWDKTYEGGRGSDRPPLWMARRCTFLPDIGIWERIAECSSSTGKMANC